MKALRALELEVIGAGGDDEYAEKVRSAGFQTRSLPVDPKGISPMADLRLLVAMYGEYRRQRPQVVHHFTIKPVIFGTLAARMAGVPKIVNTITGLGYAFTSDRIWVGRIAWFLYRVALRYADVVFFQNPDDLALFVENKLVEPAKCRLVSGSGVDLKRFRPDFTDSSLDSIDVLMVSRLLGDKGVAEFVEASRIVKSQIPGARFLILGGLDTRNPSAISSATLNSWLDEGVIEWHDQVDDVRPFIRAARIVALPSYREGTPRSLLEAAAMAKPLIATDVTGCREIVDDGVNGIRVPARDPGSLADAIKRLLDDASLRQRMGRESRRIVEQKFDETVVIEQTIESYVINNLEKQSR